jgi:hypothetical protein
VFAKKLGYASSADKGFREHLKLLERSGVVKIQQSGFRGHSLAHPKNIVLTKDISEILRFHESKSDSELRDHVCCPFCGRAIYIFDCLKNAWMLGSVVKVSFEHGLCCGKFEIITEDKVLIRELRRAMLLKSKRKKRSSLYD